MFYQVCQVTIYKFKTPQLMSQQVRQVLLAKLEHNINPEFAHQTGTFWVASMTVIVRIKRDQKSILRSVSFVSAFGARGSEMNFPLKKAGKIRNALHELVLRPLVHTYSTCKYISSVWDASFCNFSTTGTGTGTCITAYLEGAHKKKVFPVTNVLCVQRMRAASNAVTPV